MSVKSTSTKQYARFVNRASAELQFLQAPPEGWITVMRKALRMSGAKVAARMGVNRSAVYQAERNERDGAITINQMQKVAEAMGGRFVYAIVPNERVEDLIQAQARRKAEEQIRHASAHMALENQSLSADLIEERIQDLTDTLVRDRPSDFWDSK